MATPPRDPDELIASLGELVEGEAKRVLMDADLAPDPARIADGWERRFITDVRRCQEITELYEQIGYEVVADPIRPEELGDDCDDCQLALQLFRTIYTRPRRAH